MADPESNPSSTGKPGMTRRSLCRAGVGLAFGPALSRAGPAASRPAISRPAFRLRYALASCMYGKAKLADILPEVRKIRAGHIDLWPAPHGIQREQIDTMGHEAFAALLEQHKVALGIVTRYDLGPFRLQEEMRTIRKLGGKMIICGSEGPKGLAGPELRSAVRQFAEKMKPHIAAAEESGVIIGIENHGASLIESADSIRWFADSVESRPIGIALAPYHLPQQPDMIAGLIRALGPRLVHFYAWQHGKGCHQKMPKDDELLQMPGRGELDFTPILAALKGIAYAGFTEIFMHPVPRGIPILEKTAEVTAEINRARAHLEECLERT
jgi:sugar phosphate isomerase/epimerase